MNSIMGYEFQGQGQSGRGASLSIALSSMDSINRLALPAQSMPWKVVYRSICMGLPFSASPYR